MEDIERNDSSTDQVVHEKDIHRASRDLEKSHNVDQTDGHNDHLVELEVDLNRVLDADLGEGDYDEDTSPFAEVRSVVPEKDDPSMPVNTFRCWFLGIVGAYMEVQSS